MNKTDIEGEKKNRRGRVKSSIVGTGHTTKNKQTSETGYTTGQEIEKTSEGG